MCVIDDIYIYIYIYIYICAISPYILFVMYIVFDSCDDYFMSVIIFCLCVMLY